MTMDNLEKNGHGYKHMIFFFFFFLWMSLFQKEVLCSFLSIAYKKILIPKCMLDLMADCYLISWQPDNTLLSGPWIKLLWAWAI